MSDPTVLTQEDEEATRALLVGRRIVSVDKADGRLTLDDGTLIRVLPNEGCGGCGAGWYDVEHLATVDNAITDVRLSEEDHDQPDGEDPRSYRVYVIADAVEITAIQVDGDDGNGFYGTGYELYVYPATGAATA